VRELEARGREILEQLRARPDPGTLRAFVREAQAEIGAHVERAGTEPPPGRTPRPGDTVEIAGRGIRGELVEVAGGRARIQRGGLRFEVPADQLRVVEASAPRERVAIQVERPDEADALGEINLIGRRTREAVDALAAFLDRAVRAGMAEVRVVHGVGSGALRRAVHEFLASSPYCSGYHEPETGAGGGGVTIAELA
jgi:DNA mismatch repair protein MutS2